MDNVPKFPQEYEEKYFSGGHTLRDEAKAKDWSQEDFAYECGLDRSYVGGLERGERNVTLRNIEKLAQALGISVSDLTKGL
jgi:transcriptional regulator with XRE-family HTH domain